MSGRAALVTGGTRGIGQGIAEALLAAGCTVLATGVSEAEVAACPARPGPAAATLDVTDAGEVERLVAGLDRLDILVNAAGMLLRDGQGVRA